MSGMATLRRAFCVCVLISWAAADPNELRQAVSAGNATEAQALLDSGQVDFPGTSDLQVQGSTGLLFTAAARGHIEVLQLLLARWPEGAQASDEQGTTPVHVAAAQGQVNALELLCNMWPDEMLPKLNTGWTPLHAAARNGQVEALRLLLSKWPQGAQASTHGGGGTPLHVAAKLGQSEALKLLLASWPQWGSAVRGSWTPVHAAAYSGQVEVLRLLLEDWPQGVQAKDEYGSTPALKAATEGQIDAFHFLFQRWPAGVDAFDSTTITGLPCALVVDVACNRTSKRKWKDLATALQCGSPGNLSEASLQTWLDCGGDVRWRDSHGFGLLSVLEDDEARRLLKAHRTFGVLMLAVLRDWRAYAVLLSMVVVAVCVSMLEKPREPRTTKALDEELFLDGAKLLVQAGLGCASQRLWRWIEFYLAVFWFGLPLLVSSWLWWLPLLAFSYMTPAVLIYRCRDPYRDLVPTTLFTAAPASQTAAFIRTLALAGLFGLVALGLYPVAPWAGEVWHDTLFGPLLLDWQNKLHKEWATSSLRDSWLFFWAPPVTASTIFWAFYACSACVMLLYLTCLGVALLRGCICKRVQASSMCKAKDEMVWDILQKTPTQFSEVSSAMQPCRRSGLCFRLLLHWVDTLFHVNSLLMLLTTQHYLCAAAMAFAIARSTLRQFRHLRPWRLRQAIQASLERGLLRKDLIEFLQEEKRSEACLCAFITCYALLFVEASDQLLVLLCSLTLSTYRYADYAVACDALLEQPNSAGPAAIAAQSHICPEPGNEETPREPNHEEGFNDYGESEEMCEFGM